MNNSTVGTIAYIARIDTSKLASDAKTAEKEANNVADANESASDRSNKSWSNFAKAGIAAAATATAALGAVIVKASTASFDQVAAVEQATVGLKAYEKNTDKVNAVLSDLISYARSDLGVLFNRKDLFESAQSMKLNGVATEDLTNNVKILSRSVGLGLGNWKDLNAVIGRTVATGRLSGIEFDQLTQYGFKLDSSLRNTNISAKELFKVLDKGIPVDALEGQATTIQGLGIRINSAFRSIGDAVLGVDADTSKFVQGGIGSMIVAFMDKLPSAIKSITPTLRTLTSELVSFATDTVAQVGNVFDSVQDYGLMLAKKISSGDYRGAGLMIGESISKAINAALSGIKIGANVIGDFFGSIDWLKLGIDIGKNAIGFAIGLAIGLANTDIGAVFMKLVENWQVVLIGAISVALAPAKLLAPIGRILSKIPIVGAIIKWATSFIRGGAQPIRDAFTSIFSGIGPSISAGLSKIGNVIGVLKDVLFAPIRIAVDNIALAIRLLPNTIITTFTNLTGTIRLFAQGFLDIITSNFTLATNFIRNIFSPVTEFFRGIIGNIILSFDNLVTNGVNIMVGLYTRITSIFEPIGRFFGIAFRGAADQIRAFFNPIGDFFQGVWNRITTIFSQAGQGIGNGLAIAFRSVINSVINRAVGIINGFIGSINGIIGTINNIPGVNISRIGSLGVPQLATGGIVTSPTLAMIGEGRESEAVIPLSKLDKMMNKSEGGGREYNIGTININNDVDGERWLQKLTGNQEIVSGGLVPRQSYGS